ncbi:hypothetical protein [Pseudophaeobacter sp.]|uniref:hypothetical protein n=1 Tax=Pseudophaeobacter sp. TaxID=1971739 RepID=UPI00329A65B5
MAHTVHYTPTTLNILSLLAKPFVALGNGLIKLAESNSRYQTLNKLMALSDAELEERGLKRDQLVHRVYSDSYYL